jgi:hypothetical protein
MDMKKILYSLFSVLLLAGVSGCMSQPTAKDKKSSESAMLSYLSDKYDQDFSKVKYMAAKREFNDSMKENILIAKSDDGVQVNVRERLGEKGEFYDDYLNSFASKLYEDKINYGAISQLDQAKTYIAVKSDVGLDEVQSKQSNLSKEDVFMVYSIISVKGKADEQALKGLYDVYQQIQALGYQDSALIAAFSADQEKAKPYVNNYFLYGHQDWEQYDKDVKQVLRVNENGLSFEEFKNKLVSVGG